MNSTVLTVWSLILVLIACLAILVRIAAGVQGERDRQVWDITLYSGDKAVSQWVGWNMNWNGSYACFTTSNGFMRVHGTLVLNKRSETRIEE